MLVPLKFRPGVFRNGTRYQAKGRWYDASLVRFLEQSVRPIGGWEAVEGASAVETAVIRDTYTDTPGTGITTHVCEAPGGSYTKSGATTTDIQNNQFRAMGGTQYWVLLATDAVNSENALEWVLDFTRTQFTLADSLGFYFFARANSTGGLRQDGIGFRLVPVDANTVEFSAVRGSGGTLAESAVLNGSLALANGGGQVRFVMVFNGNTVSYYTETWGGGGGRTLIGSRTFSSIYQDTSHRRLRYEIDGNPSMDVRIGAVEAIYATPLSGVPRAMLGWKNNAGNSAQLALGTNNKLYRFTQGVLSDITPAGLTTGGADTIFAIGPYGNGNYGAFNYGEGDPAQGSEVEAAVWALDTWGEDLVGVLTSDGRLFVYDISVGGASATAITAATGAVPTGCKALVVTPERFLFALGADGDPRLIRWPSQETLDQWGISATSTAGDFSLSGEGVIMCGVRGRNETLIFTDKDLFAAQYIGGVLIYSFRQVGSGCGVISRRAATVVDGKAAWMGQRSFFIYDGYPRPIPSDLNDYVFGDFNRSQRHKCFVVPMTFFGEVWWFYPSASSQEPDRYVIWNYMENHWTPGKLSRVSGIDRGAFTYPMMSSSTTVYDHERGSSRPGVSVAPFLESGPIEVGDGDRLLAVRRLIPDEATILGQQLGSLRAFLYSAYFPTGAETTHGPFTLANPTPLRLAARQVRVRLEEVVAGDWRFGDLRLDGMPGSGR